MENAKSFVRELAEYAKEYNPNLYEAKAADAEENEKEAIEMLQNGEIDVFKKYIYRAIDNSGTMAQREFAEKLLNKLA